MESEKFLNGENASWKLWADFFADLQRNQQDIPSSEKSTILTEVSQCDKVTPAIERQNVESPYVEIDLKPYRIDFQNESHCQRAECELSQAKILSLDNTQKSCDDDCSSISDLEPCNGNVTNCFEWDRNKQGNSIPFRLNLDSMEEDDELSEYEDSFDFRSEGSDFDEARSPLKKGVMSLEGKLHDLCKFTFTVCDLKIYIFLIQACVQKKRKSLELQIQAEKLNLETEIDHYQLLQSEKLKRVMQDYNNQNENIQTRRKRLKTLMREQCESFRNLMVKVGFDEERDVEESHRKKTFIFEQVMHIKRVLPKRVSNLQENCFELVCILICNSYSDWI